MYIKKYLKTVLTTVVETAFTCILKNVYKGSFDDSHQNCLYIFLLIYTWVSKLPLYIFFIYGVVETANRLKMSSKLPLSIYF